MRPLLCCPVSRYTMAFPHRIRHRPQTFLKQNRHNGPQQILNIQLVCACSACRCLFSPQCVHNPPLSKILWSEQTLNMSWSILKLHAPLMHGGEPANHFVLVSVCVLLYTKQSKVWQSSLIHGRTHLINLRWTKLHLAPALLMDGFVNLVENDQMENFCNIAQHVRVWVHNNVEKTVLPWLNLSSCLLSLGQEPFGRQNRLTCPLRCPFCGQSGKGASMVLFQRTIDCEESSRGPI